MGVDDAYEGMNFSLGDSLSEEDQERKRKYIKEYLSQRSQLLTNTTEAFDRVTSNRGTPEQDLGFIYYQGFVLTKVAIDEAEKDGNEESAESFREELSKMKELVDPNALKEQLDKSKRIERTSHGLQNLLEGKKVEVLESVIWIFSNTPVDQEGFENDNDSDLHGS